MAPTLSKTATADDYFSRIRIGSRAGISSMTAEIPEPLKDGDLPAAEC